VKLLKSIYYGDNYTICPYILWIISTIRILLIPISLIFVRIISNFRTVSMFEINETKGSLMGSIFMIYSDTDSLMLITGYRYLNIGCLHFTKKYLRVRPLYIFDFIPP
jgi:hypothetical protein